MKRIICTCFLVVSLFAFETKAATPAFPTAEGYGKWATGGRGGKVVEVTTVEDDGTANLVGSLRWALKQHSGEPITIVFKVSGIIDLKGVRLGSQRNNVTIAGQTAPGDGICIKGEAFKLSGSFNTIVRHLRFRTGAYTPAGVAINAASVIHENGGNFIWDHCSLSWSSEENCDFADADNLTVQWCTFTEGLYNSVNGKGARSYGAVLAGEGASYHHNLLAHNVSRAPRFGVSTSNDPHMLVDYVNNVNYNFGKATACYGGENEMGRSGSVQINFVNNYYKHGPAYTGDRSAYFVAASYEVGIQGTAYSKWHMSGNYIDGSANQKLNTDNYNGLKFDEYLSNVPTCTINDLKSAHHAVRDSIPTETAQNAFNSVMAGVGAFPRDTVDRRIIREARTGTATYSSSFNNHRVCGIIDKPEDVGGFPEYKTYNITADADHDGMADYWEKANGLNSADPADRNILSPQGYTNLEVYLNGLCGEYLEGYQYPAPEYIDSTVNSIDAMQVPVKRLLYDGSNRMLTVKGQEDVASLVVYNACGKVVLTSQGKDTAFCSVSQLPEGFYVACLQTKDLRTERLKFLR